MAKRASLAVAVIAGLLTISSEAVAQEKVPRFVCWDDPVYLKNSLYLVLADDSGSVSPEEFINPAGFDRHVTTASVTEFDELATPFDEYVSSGGVDIEEFFLGVDTSKVEYKVSTGFMSVKRGNTAFVHGPIKFRPDLTDVFIVNAQRRGDFHRNDGSFGGMHILKCLPMDVADKSWSWFGQK